jgi:CheY-like chemotaxis protein
MPGPQNTDRCCNVLLVEDNVDACETLQHFLSAEGHDVAVAYDGRAGLEAALERRFDVVICDIGLPGIDGYDLMRTLRAHPEGRWPLAVALSGYGQDDDRERAIGAGFDHYFVKPASSEALLALLASCGKRRPQA